MKRISKKRMLIILSTLTIVVGICFAISRSGLIYILNIQEVSYDSKSFFENQSYYETMAKLCYDDFTQNDDIDIGSYYPYRGRNDYIECFFDEHKLMMTENECIACDKVCRVFRLDKHCLCTITAHDNFVVFGIENGRASFIYSVNDSMPTFVNSYKENRGDVCIRKITANWYFACTGVIDYDKVRENIM